jgi:hypothetical protein
LEKDLKEKNQFNN